MRYSIKSHRGKIRNLARSNNTETIRLIPSHNLEMLSAKIKQNQKTTILEISILIHSQLQPSQSSCRLKVLLKKLNRLRTPLASAEISNPHLLTMKQSISKQTPTTQVIFRLIISEIS